VRQGNLRLLLSGGRGGSISVKLRIPQWVFDQYPWLHDVFSVLALLQELWHDYQGIVVLLGFFYVLRRLRRERVALSERIDTLGLIVRATRDEAEAALGLPPPPPLTPLPQPPAPPELPPQGPAPEVLLPPAIVQPAPGEADALANWETIRLGWRDIRDRLEYLIEGLPSRLRRKYSRIPRYTYREVINALQRDGVIRAAQVADALRSMDTTFQILRFRPRRVSAADVAEFRNRFELVDPDLPRLPDEDDGLPPNPAA
jgi:hypothetical protein